MYFELEVEVVVLLVHPDGHEALREVAREVVIFLFVMKGKFPTWYKKSDWESNFGGAEHDLSFPFSSVP